MSHPANPLPSPAVLAFRTHNARAAAINQQAVAAELIRLDEIGPDAYAAELNEEADRQATGAAYEALAH